jgi:hypothetical protein
VKEVFGNTSATQKFWLFNSSQHKGLIECSEGGNIFE